MKKFVSALLAVTMLLTFCGVAAFAADTTVITLGLAKTPSIDGVVSDPANIHVGDVFEVAVKFTNIQGESFTSAQVIVNWDPAKVQPLDSTGVDATTKKKVVNPNIAILPEEDEDGEDLFDWFANTVIDTEKGELNLTTTISPSNKVAKIGYPLNGVKEFDFFTLRFKALGEGSTGIAINKQILYLGTSKAELTVEPVEFTIKGSEPGPVLDKITAIEAPVVPAEVTVDDEVKLPATAKATVEGKTEAVELPITWTPASVDTSKAGEVAIKGVVDTTGYEVDANVKTEYEFKITVKEKEPVPPAVKTITKIEAPVIDLEVEEDTTVELPSEVDATVEGETQPLKLALTWQPDMVDTTAPGETTIKATAAIPEGYEVAEGVAVEFEFTVTVIPKEPVPPTVKTITEIKAPVVESPVHVGDTVTLPATVDATVDGETEPLALALTWSPAEVDTSRTGRKTVRATAEIPEGYELARGVSNTFSITVVVETAPVGPDVPEKEVIEKVPYVEVPAAEELPATVEVTLASGETVTVGVTWSAPDETGKVIGTIVPEDAEKYELGEGVEINAYVVPPVNAPVSFGDVVVERQPDGSINVLGKLVYNPDYDKDQFELGADNEKLWIAYTVMNGNAVVVKGVFKGLVPINVGTIVNAPADDPAIIEVNGAVGGDTIKLSLVRDVDWDEVLSGDNVGIPVSQGYTAVAE